MSFPWLHGTPPRPHGADHRTTVATAELASRAGVLYRLGFSQAAAIHRLVATVAWEYEPESRRGAHRRPDALSDQAIAKIVSDVYARRPG